MPNTLTPPRQLIPRLKADDQDYEFYPTTGEILSRLITHMQSLEFRGASFLDIGAGNGKVLRAVKEAEVGIGSLYAIEKSPILCGQLDPEVFVIGTDFKEQTLFAKEVNILFSNPPYSVYEDWTEKILRENAARHVYLVIPDRWATDDRILQALKYRGILLPDDPQPEDASDDPRDWRFHRERRRPRVEIVGSFTFERSEDRTARARVHLLHIPMASDKDDAFERFFDEQFGDLKARFEGRTKDPDYFEKREQHKRKFDTLVVGENYPVALFNLYMADMALIDKNYRAVATLDADLLREFQIFPDKILKLLKERLTELRMLYWKELFDHLSTITDRLTSASRKALLGTLHSHMHVDFTVPNIHAVAVWAIKNANRYLDTQLLEVYGEMISNANVHNYKSNQRPFKYDRWRYKEDRDTVSHFYLDYRIVIEHLYALRKSDYSFEKGLSERAMDFLADLRTIASNMGFLSSPDQRLQHYGRQEWKRGQVEAFDARHPKTGEWIELFEVRAFENGNIHLRLHQDFALRLNVEYGRLKGWLRSGIEAANELGDKGALHVFKKQGLTPRLMDDAPLALGWRAAA